MKEKLRRAMLGFLQNHMIANRPILLGLSGGPDSLSLLYLLLECRKRLDIQLGIAHVDHGWRPESQQEAETLRHLATELQVPFHIKTINPQGLLGNLEAACREERFNFFAALCEEHRYQAVILAHHQDDQAETVLKNILEGASLTSCTGMSEISVIGKLNLWRPLIHFPKKALEQWIEGLEFSPFFDATNLDSRFLRGRMRTEIIPSLGEFFGKGITRPLSYIGKESQELDAFMKKYFETTLSSIERSCNGSSIDLKHLSHTTPFEMKYIIRKVCELEQCFPSKDILEKTSQHLLSRSANRQFFKGDHMIQVDRGRLVVRNMVNNVERE